MKDTQLHQADDPTTQADDPTTDPTNAGQTNAKKLLIGKENKFNGEQMLITRKLALILHSKYRHFFVCLIDEINSIMNVFFSSKQKFESLSIEKLENIKSKIWYLWTIVQNFFFDQQRDIFMNSGMENASWAIKFFYDATQKNIMKAWKDIPFRWALNQHKYSAKKDEIINRIGDLTNSHDLEKIINFFSEVEELIEKLILLKKVYIMEKKDINGEYYKNMHNVYFRKVLTDTYKQKRKWIPRLIGILKKAAKSQHIDNEEQKIDNEEQEKVLKDAYKTILRFAEDEEYHQKYKNYEKYEKYKNYERTVLNDELRQILRFIKEFEEVEITTDKQAKNMETILNHCWYLACVERFQDIVTHYTKSPSDKVQVSWGKLMIDGEEYKKLKDIQRAIKSLQTEIYISYMCPMKYLEDAFKIKPETNTVRIKKGRVDTLRIKSPEEEEGAKQERLDARRKKLYAEQKRLDAASSVQLKKWKIRETQYFYWVSP
jgi:hypothetical protein